MSVNKDSNKKLVPQRPQFCMYCGTPVADEKASFCMVCGKPLATSSPESYDFSQINPIKWPAYVSILIPIISILFLYFVTGIVDIIYEFFSPTL